MLKVSRKPTFRQVLHGLSQLGQTRTHRHHQRSFLSHAQGSARQGRTSRRRLLHVRRRHRPIISPAKSWIRQLVSATSHTSLQRREHTQELVPLRPRVLSGHAHLLQEALRPHAPLGYTAHQGCHLRALCHGFGKHANRQGKEIAGFCRN